MKKYFATFKYLFFPFLMANSTGSDFTKVFHNQDAVSVIPENIAFHYLGPNADFWKINAEAGKAQQNEEHTYFLPACEVKFNCPKKNHSI